MPEIPIGLLPAQIEFLRGVIYEYYNILKVPYNDTKERNIHMQIEAILADAEDRAYNLKK
jgi:hypothetical protein